MNLMAGVIQAQNFRLESFYYGPGKARDYALRHLPTGRQWVRPKGAPTAATSTVTHDLFIRANDDLIALGWRPDEDWLQRVDEMRKRRAAR